MTRFSLQIIGIFAALLLAIGAAAYAERADHQSKVGVAKQQVGGILREWSRGERNFVGRLDPWGREIEVSVDPVIMSGFYVSARSVGPDGVLGTPDDVSASAPLTLGEYLAEWNRNVAKALVSGVEDGPAEMPPSILLHRPKASPLGSW